jgi:hypothetical protein
MCYYNGQKVTHAEFNPSKEYQQRIAQAQVPSKDIELCSITKGDLQRIANLTEYIGLLEMDISYMDMEEQLLYPAA